MNARDAWRRFSAVWPFDPVPYRRAAAEAAFAALTETEREEAIRCAQRFMKARRAGGSSGWPDARRWIKAKGWEAFKRASMNSPLVCRRNNSRGLNI